MLYPRPIAGAAIALLAWQASAACNGDNLLNAFVRTPNAAAAFCATYTIGTTNPIPTFVPTTYGSSRYSSACTCIATTTLPTTTLVTVTSLSSATSPCVPTTITASASTVTLSASTITVSASTVTLPASIVTVTASTISITVTYTQTVTGTSNPTSITSTSTTSNAPVCLATSVITNGGFESSKSSILPWTLSSATNAAGPLIETYMPHTGTYSIMAYHGAGAPQYTLAQTVTVCPDTPYTFSFWAHTDGEPYTTTCALQVCFGTDCAIAATIGAANTVWSQYSRQFVGSDATTLQVSITTPACGLFILYDDIAMMTI